jgi:hypothetical protein
MQKKQRASIQVLFLFINLLNIWNMVIEGSREYKAAQELERALNDYSWNPKKFAESTRYYHRTLQQELMKTIVEIIRMVGNKNYGTDLRNQASHELCKRIVDSGVLDEAHLPFI